MFGLNLLKSFAWIWLFGLIVFASAPVQAVPNNDKQEAEESSAAPATEEDKPDWVIGGIKNEEATEAYTEARPNARTMALQIPAPRGLIVDRHGEPLAQTKVAYQLALRFGQFENEDRDYIVNFGRKCLDEAHKITEKTWEFSDEQLWQHYRHRRWLALPLTNALKPDEVEKIKTQVEGIRGLELLPIYIRFYPEKKSAAAMIGYVGAKGKLPTGPINNMDPLWELSQGRSGLEQEFDSQLMGKPGVWRLMFNEKGEKILDELQVRPKPGGTLVTTLDLKWQKIAENVLAKRARRAAFVLLDCKSGEILVMASAPSYDPNMFIPNISSKDYAALRDDPARPMWARAYQGVYPPASTFKTVVVLAALANGTLTESKQINAPAAVTIGTGRGSHTINNHNKKPAGFINCIQGLAQSNNPFMCLVALNLDGRGGANPPLCGKYLIDAARALGFGSRTKLPIPDSAGHMPYDNNGRSFTQGDIGNMSIGQGVLLATPLQVARSIAGIANGYGLPKLHLVKQIQDSNANVIYVARPEIETSLAGYERAAAIVRKGMKAVVDGGTGRRAALSYTANAGKTGTGQWVYKSKEARVGWFTGFLPYDNPRFAYAALYEGIPGEKVGGSSHAGPIVKDFFEQIKDDMKAILKPDSESAIPMAEPDGDEEEDIPTTPIVPRSRDNLPRGLYNPDDVVPIPANAIPVDIDDSADGYNGTASRAPVRDETSMYPQPGDSDYIPGLEEQIPRHLLKRTERQITGHTSNHTNGDDIPVAVPVL